MNKCIKGLSLVAVIMFMSSANAKSANEFYDDMNRMCADTNTKSSTVFITSCYQYIRGFLQGAIITDTAIMEEIENTGFDTGFANRAYRTRVGIERKTAPATLYAGFCLPDDMVTHEVVVNLLEDVQKRFEQVSEGIPGNPLSEHLYELLKKRHPCEQEPQAVAQKN